MAEDKRTNVNISADGGGSVSIGGNANVGGIVEGPQAAFASSDGGPAPQVDPFDLFISYASADRAVVDPLAKALGEAGLSIWYDRELLAGDRYLVEINARLAAARAVLVVWSETSVKSEWVLNEAEIARTRGALLAVRLDTHLPPAPFRLMHAPPLLDAQKALSHLTLAEVTRQVEALPPA